MRLSTHRVTIWRYLAEVNVLCSPGEGEVQGEPTGVIPHMDASETFQDHQELAGSSAPPSTRLGQSETQKVLCVSTDCSFNSFS